MLFLNKSWPSSTLAHAHPNVKLVQAPKGIDCLVQIYASQYDIEHGCLSTLLIAADL